MYIRPGLHVLQCSADEIQIGTDPRWSIRLKNLTTSEVAGLLRLPLVAPSVVSDKAAELSPRVRDALVAACVLMPEPLSAPTSGQEAGPGPIPAPALVSAPAPASRSSSPRTRPEGSPAKHPDSDAWSQLRVDGHGDRTISVRATRTVGILGLGRVGLRIAQCLTTAGVGHLLLDDARAVRSVDLGLGGYTIRDLNQPRHRATTRLVTDGALGTPTPTVPLSVTTYDVATDLSTLDVVVVTGFGGLDPVWMWRLLSEQIPHLPIVWNEAGATVGPVVLPGRTPCLRCIDLHRRDEDSAWPLLASQLNALASSDHVEESLVANTASAIAVGQVLTVLDERPLPGPGTAYEVVLPDALPRLRRWSTHPDCGCTDLRANNASED